MDLGLRGRTALVTGSHRGTGAAIATVLAAEGASVVVHGFEADAAETMAQYLAAREWMEAGVDPGTAHGHFLFTNNELPDALQYIIIFVGFLVPMGFGLIRFEARHACGRAIVFGIVDVSPDGRLLMARLANAPTEPVEQRLVVVQNWVAAFRQ